MLVEWQLPYVPVCKNMFYSMRTGRYGGMRSEFHSLEFDIRSFMSSAVAKKYFRGLLKRFSYYFFPALMMEDI